MAAQCVGCRADGRCTACCFFLGKWAQPCCLQMLTQNYHSHWAPADQLWLPSGFITLQGWQDLSVDISRASPRWGNRGCRSFLMKIGLSPSTGLLEVLHSCQATGFVMTLQACSKGLRGFILPATTLCPRTCFFSSLGFFSSVAESLQLQAKV